MIAADSGWVRNSTATYQAKPFFSTLYGKTPYQCRFHTTRQVANEKTKPYVSIASVAAICNVAYNHDNSFTEL